jgi:hypothetical protein
VEAGTSKTRGVQGCTISLQAAVHQGRMPRALLEKKKKFSALLNREEFTSHDNVTCTYTMCPLLTELGHIWYKRTFL